MIVRVHLFKLYVLYLPQLQPQLLLLPFWKRPGESTILGNAAKAQPNQIRDTDPDYSER